MPVTTSNPPKVPLPKPSMGWQYTLTPTWPPELELPAGSVKGAVPVGLDPTGKYDVPVMGVEELHVPDCLIWLMPHSMPASAAY